ncbi:hypothetical protein [Microcoleus sp. T3_D1]|uniref:hypothetical protein n=1 Tax=Microcoleus sp. T3_D1 TaxID=3055427 RepID=UPI002FD0A2ED
MRDGSCGMGVPPVQKGRAFWPNPYSPQTCVNYLIRDPYPQRRTDDDVTDCFAIGLTGLVR